MLEIQHRRKQSRRFLEFSILREGRKGTSRTTTLDCWRADFGQLRRWADRLPGKAVLKDKGVQEGWTLFMKEILKQAVPMCPKKSQQ